MYNIPTVVIITCSVINIVSIVNNNNMLHKRNNVDNF
jgi:hypothetical protein